MDGHGREEEEDSGHGREEEEEDSGHGREEGEDSGHGREEEGEDSGQVWKKLRLPSELKSMDLRLATSVMTFSHNPVEGQDGLSYPFTVLLLSPPMLNCIASNGKIKTQT